jgi:hypothetical protein
LSTITYAEHAVGVGQTVGTAGCLLCRLLLLKADVSSDVTPQRLVHGQLEKVRQLGDTALRVLENTKVKNNKRYIEDNIYNLGFQIM